MEFTVQTRQGLFDLKADCKFIGKDLLVAVWGGEKPHIGAVAVAHPRPSLKNPETTSASASVICLTGHKEDDLAKRISLHLSSRLHTNVVVTAGIHWDDISPEGIQKVLENCEILTNLILKRIP